MTLEARREPPFLVYLDSETGEELARVDLREMPEKEISWAFPHTASLTERARRFLAEGKTTDIEYARVYAYHAEKQEREGLSAPCTLRISVS